MEPALQDKEGRNKKEWNPPYKMKKVEIKKNGTRPTR